MKTARSALIVDDEHRWRQFYEDEVRLVGVNTVRAAKDLADAVREIESMRFTVALVDVGLEEDNDRNIDGLQVMEKIRKAGDQTSIIVVTGRSGPDVLSIVRDSIRKYNALDTIPKASLEPENLEALVGSGISLYEKATAASNERSSLFDALHGDLEGVVWDDRIMRGINTEGGVAALYAIAEGLFAPFLPLMPGTPCGVNLRQNLACGAFWSRGVGEPVLGCFGSEKHIQTLAMQAKKENKLFGSYNVGDLLHEHRHRSMKGVVYLLKGFARTDFASADS
jgi:CheY-like chemotaxis protein